MDSLKSVIPSHIDQPRAKRQTEKMSGGIRWQTLPDCSVYIVSEGDNLETHFSLAIQ